MSYNDYVSVPELVVGEKDVRVNETVTYIASRDEDMYRKVRRDRILIILTFIFAFPIILLGIAFGHIIYIFFMVFLCSYIVSVAKTACKEHKRPWELFLTDFSLCHRDPSAPIGTEFIVIPLADIGSVRAQRGAKFCYRSTAVEVNIKNSAPAVTSNKNNEFSCDRLVITRTIYIRYVLDTEDFIERLNSLLTPETRQGQVVA